MQMEAAVAIVGWNHPSWRRDRFLASTLPKDQQNLPAGNAERAHATIVQQLWKAEDPLVKCDGPIELLDVESGLNDTANRWHARLIIGFPEPIRKSITSPGRVAQLAEQVT